MSRFLATALHYAADLGWPVLPIAPRGKTPLTEHGFLDATTDGALIQRWWSQWPDANIGVACGWAFDVLDIDGSVGESTLKSLSNGHFLPETMEQITGRGRQLLFKPGVLPCTAGKLGPGLDTRGHGGYAVLPPSIHATGREYRWADGRGPTIPLAQAPTWILERLKGRAGEETRQGSIPRGARNATLASMAGAMRRRGMSLAAIEAALLAENNACCNPPLDEGEVRRIAKSVSRYAPEEPREELPVESYEEDARRSEEPGKGGNGAKGNGEAGEAKKDPADPKNKRRTKTGFTDLGNAHRFAQDHGVNVRYAWIWTKWLVWNGRYWRRDDTGAVHRLAAATVRGMYAEAAQNTTRGMA